MGDRERDVPADGDRAVPPGQPHRGAHRVPGWVRWFVAVGVLVVALLAVAMLTGLGGEHGPGRHLGAAAAAAVPDGAPR